ncbi:MAG: low temperature requirement protein A [Chloroflexi bacterium]|nr:low temperature requirement protein A [Chloroflexota bacterium]
MPSRFAHLSIPLKLRDPLAEKTRHATWTELFYDLVFVIAIAELGHSLSGDITPLGVFKFVALFIPIWRVWVHHTYYADRFDPDDSAHRLLTFAQMIAIAILAASVHAAVAATDNTSIQFALSLVAVRVLLIVMYNRARPIEASRPLVNRLILTLSVGASLWFVSVFIPLPWRYLVWALALVSEITLSYLPSTRAIFAALPVSHTHVPERFGLFTIIFLGESIAGMVAGLTEHDFEIIPYAIAILGFLITFSLWWLYFGNVKETALERLGVWSASWIYLHLPFMMGLAALGVAIEHAIAADAEHAMEAPTVYLLAGTLALVFASLGYLHVILSRFEEKPHNRPQANWRFTAAVLALLIGYFVAATEGSPLLLLILLGGLTLLQVVGDLFIHLVPEVEDNSASFPFS